MASLVVLVPGDLQSRTGGYGYDRRIIAGLRQLGWTVDVRALDSSFPFPTVRARLEAVATLASLADQQLVLIDGLAFGAMAVEAEHERARLRIVALVHHPLAAETGVSREAAAVLEDSERRALACARLVIVTSRPTIRSLMPYDVPADRIVVVEPGTDPGPLTRGSGDAAVHMLCVASVTPRKGYETLMQALGTLRDLTWRLTIVGSLDRAPDTAERVCVAVVREGLADRVTFRGELGPDEVAECYAHADLFVLPSFHEGYGMVVAEAIAHGIPVVGTPTGAVPALVGEEAGLLVPAGDAEALARALRTVLSDRATRARLAEGARRRRHDLPSWTAAAAAMALALGRVSTDE